jgi:hypothetical protein
MFATMGADIGDERAMTVTRQKDGDPRMIDLPEPSRDDTTPSHPLHHPAARRRGQRTLRRWTALGIAGVLGLTAVTAGLAFEVSSSQQSKQDAAAAKIRAQYAQRTAAYDASLAAAQRQARAVARTLAHHRAVLAARLRAREQQLAALQAAAAARAASASAHPVYVATRSGGGTTTSSARTASGRTTATTAAQPTAPAVTPSVAAPTRSGEDGGRGTATSGGS